MKDTGVLAEVPEQDRREVDAPDSVALEGGDDTEFLDALVPGEVIDELG
jgi:hypothetical protein